MVLLFSVCFHICLRRDGGRFPAFSLDNQHNACAPFLSISERYPLFAILVFPIH